MLAVFWCAGQAMILNVVIWDYKPHQTIFESLPIVFNEFWMEHFFRHSLCIFKSYSSLLPLQRSFSAAQLSLSFPFSQMLFVYNFILTPSCYSWHLSPEISFLSTLPAFLYLLSDLLGSYLLVGLPADFESDPSEIQELVCCLLLHVVLNWKHGLSSYKGCMIAGFTIL